MNVPVPATRAGRFRAGITAAALAVVLLCARNVAADPIVITPGSATPEQVAAELVAQLLGVNSGITVVGTPTYTGSLLASSRFSGGTGILPFDSGVLLTTGSATLVPGPNNDPFAGLDHGLAGDPRLDAVAGVTTFDAALLSFNFVPAGDRLSFDYVFGSEEYTFFGGADFSDVFAFFLDGVNVALIPGTVTPVAINTVNANTNSQYYIDNGGSTLNIQYTALVGASPTARLSVNAPVTPGAQHNITLGIADAGDGIYDSGVMIAAGTFASPPPVIEPPSQPPPMTPVPEPSTMILTGTGALAILRYARKRRGR